MFGYRLKWNFLKSNFLCLPFNRLGPTTNFFCHRCFYRFSCCAKRLTNNLAIDRFIDTANFLATCLSFLKDTFFISIAICICYIFGFIRKDHCFCNRSFRYLVSWILRLNRSFAHMTFFLRPLGFNNTGISWVLWLYRSFPCMTFFLCSFSSYNWNRLRTWLNLLLCSNSNYLWNCFFCYSSFKYFANFLTIYRTHFC